MNSIAPKGHSYLLIAVILLALVGFGLFAMQSGAIDSVNDLGLLHE